MANSMNAMRLAKAAQEFNVGVTTIIEFLKKKGFDEDFKPSSKLEPEMVSLLVAEYQSEKLVKAKANERVMATDRTPVSIREEEEDHDQDDDDSDKDSEDLIIRDTAITAEIHKAPAREKAVEKPKTETVEQPVVKEPVVHAEKAIETPKVENTPIQQEPIKPKVEQVPEPPKIEKEPVAISETHIEEKPAPVLAKEEVKEVVKEEPKAEKISPPAPKAMEKSEDKSFTPKVVDKIDLDNTNWSTRPKPKSKEEKKKDRQRKIDEEKQQRSDSAQAYRDSHKVEEKPSEIAKPADSAQHDKEPEIETIRARADKLTGPVVLRTIVLEEPRKDRKKQPEASSSSDNKKKKKRVRIKKPINPNGEAGKPNQTQGQGGQHQGGAPRSNHPGNQHGNQQGGGGASNADRTRRKGKKPITPVKLVKKVEPTEDEIRKKIKDTLARLAPSGKSKTSKHRRNKRDAVSKEAEAELLRGIEGQKIIKVAEYVTANDLANMIDIPVTKIIATCMGIGLFVSINQRLDAETLVLVAEEFGYSVEFVGVEATGAIEYDDEDFGDEDLEFRSPVVTVMGHVDHGKTKLLDYVRKANVVAGEAGGITQHIGAYEVVREDGKSVTFLDTPGHEAFTAMRARGAKVTDIAIIVIAADDRVMPQTKEAINHAQAAGIPIVFAINKVDKPTANPDNIKTELSQMNILVEEWGGKYQSQEISALKGDGVNELIEKVLLEAEMLDLKATPKRRAIGSVIESSLDKGRGYVTKILVQDGTLRIGDMVLAGSCYGKVKAMFNERNQSLKEAGPSTPVLMLGLNAAPQAGDNFNVMTDEREVKNIATKREQLQREQSIRTQKHITLDEIGRRLAIGDFKELNVIVKADVDGSVEALSDSLIKLSTSEIQLNVIHKSVGQISESDVLLASASDAIIVGFQVRPNMQARRLAENEGIQIKLYSIIYQAIEELKLALEGMLSPDEEEKIVANVEVREVFKITKVGTIAGCMVLDGKITRNTPIRLIRDGVVIYSGKLGSLKRFKDDVREVATGYECGLNIDNFNDIKIGDIVEGYEIVEVKRKL